MYRVRNSTQLNILIYLPGIGDHRKLIFWYPKIWKLLGINSQVYRIHWKDNGPFQPRFQKLLEEIDSLAKAGYKVSLVGASAGASLALNAYMEKKKSIHKVIFVCGKLRRFESIRASYFEKNPTLKPSLTLLEKNLALLEDSDKKKMISLKPLYDRWVPPADTEIPGVKSLRMLTAGHLFSIGAALTIYAPFISHYVKAD